MKSLESRVDKSLFSPLGKKIATYLLTGSLIGCAGINQGCAHKDRADSLADCIIVQYDAEGEPMNCWRTSNTNVRSDDFGGIYWTNGESNTIHIFGNYALVRVNNDQHALAAKSLGVDLNHCTGGAYRD